MAMEYTEEQLNNFDKTTLVQLFLIQQSQLKDIDQKLQLLLEQVAVLNNKRFGKSSEKLDIDNQICFMEVDGNIVYFNEAEAVAALDESDEDKVKNRGKKLKGKRVADIQDLPVIPIEHKMSEEELRTEFGENGWYQLEDEIYRRYRFTPMKVEIEEHHVGVYKSKKDNHFKKAEHPAYLLRNSLVSASLLAGIWNAKYVNAVPLYRQEQDFQRMGVNIDRADMAHWTILCAERYLSIFYDYLHEKMYDYHVLQADETPVLVTKENRTAGKNLSTEERQKHRQLTVKPLVDAYFAWVKQHLTSVPGKSKIANGFTYSINQEKYLRVFLENGEVPLDNNTAEQAIRPFCIGKKNWVMIDTIAGAEASAIIYSIAETAKANNLKPYDYFEYLLTEIPKHMDDYDVSFCEDLLLWSDKLPVKCRKV